MANKVVNNNTDVPVQTPTHVVGHSAAGLFVRQVPASIAFSGASTDATNAVTVVTSTTYTLLATDNNKLITFNNSATITVSLPATFSVGFACSCVQIGAGKIKFVPVVGAEIRNSDSHNGSRAIYSALSLAVYSNAGGNTANYSLSGDTATVA